MKVSVQINPLSRESNSYSSYFFLTVSYGRNMAYNGLSQHVDFLRLSNPTERFELLDLIGEGTYGEVYSAKDKHTGRKYAVKVSEIFSII